MKFTIVFPSSESSDFSIGAVFIPCLVWVEGNKKILNPHRDNPHYLKGDLQNLFDNTNLRERIAKHTNKVTLIVHLTVALVLKLLASDMSISEGNTARSRKF